MRRTVSAAITKEPRCNGNVETWRAIVRRDSILVWHFRSFARKRARLRAWAASPDGPDVLLFRRPRDLEAWLATLGPVPVDERP